MNHPNPTCTRCGAPIPPGASDQLCPACLMSGALKSPMAETVSLQSSPAIQVPEAGQFPCDFGGYRLQGLLGRGGMGTVYDACEISTGRRVALKTLGKKLDSPEMRQRFLREGRLAARVNHPNSLYVFHSEEIEGHPVITMEIAAGGTLKDQLKQRGPLPVSEAVDAVLDVIAGLESAWSGGVLHRDVKPSNCFVGPHHTVKVGDFGLSVSTLPRNDSFVTAHGKVLGTPAYASPEQLRGDALDVRADIYSVGATLFTLLSNRAPFEGENAIQVVANAVNQDPIPLSQLRDDIPPELERVVTRCLAKEPQGRYPDYGALRDALLPFSSREPEPASLVVRSSAGWIDYLIAFLPPYVALMLLVGADGLFVRPLVERTLFASRFYFVLLGFGILYFALCEGIWGAGVGKWLKGLRVVDADHRAPGIGKALVRILIPVACCEGVRMPWMMASISSADWSTSQTALYVIAAIICGSLPFGLAWSARRETGYATAWDRASRTRVVIRQKGDARPAIQPVQESQTPVVDEAATRQLGPFRVTGELISAEWLVANDPLLRRPVWLLRRSGSPPPDARCRVARSGRPRWLQKVESDGVTWDAYEAPAGMPLATRIAEAQRVPWRWLRYWLHDLASELWEASGDHSLPAELSTDHVWITVEGRALLLDRGWPEVDPPAPRIDVHDLAGQQQFLAAVAAHVETTGLPLHARPVLNNLEAGKFEKLSFLAGNLRGLLSKPAEVTCGIRAGSIFLLPSYIWISVLVGRYHDKPWDDWMGILVNSALLVLMGIALLQLLGIPLGGTASQWIFRLAVVDADGQLASKPRLLARWAIVWLPLFVPMALLILLVPQVSEGSAVTAAMMLWLLIWIGAAVQAAMHPHRGWHDRLAGTWVVRR